jgi:hypothetical protein
MDGEARPQPTDRCPCGNRSFLVTTEKLYAAAVDAEGVLACLEQSEFIKSIACSKCGREFAQGDFKGVDF